MKAFITVLALIALYGQSAFAAPDYYAKCKAELSSVANQMSSYLGSASSECLDELNKSASERNNQALGQACPGAQRLLPLKQRAYAVCGQCRRLGNQQINAACTDNGLSSFIDAVGSL